MARPILRDAKAFETLFGNDQVVMLLVEPNTRRIVDANPAAARFYGWSAEALRSRTLTDLDVDGPPQASNPDASLPADARHRRADGTVREVRVANAPVRVREKNLWYVIVHDVSDLVETRARLRLRDQALDVAASAVALTDPEGRIVWCNPAFTKLTGYGMDEAMGRTHGELLHSGRQGKDFYRDLWVTVSRGEVWHGELINRRKDGTEYPEEMTITPVCDADGRPHHFIAVKQDISERIQRERDQRRWVAVFAHAHVGIVLSDPSGTRIAWTNRAFANMHASSEEALAGRPIEDVTVPEDRAALEAALATAAQEGHAVFEARRRRDDGTTFPAYVDMTHVAPDDDLEAALIATVHDITHLKRTEAQLDQQRRRAELAAHTANLGFWTLYLPSRTVTLSDGWKRQKGYAPSDIADTREAWEGLLHPSDVETARHTLQAYLAKPSGPYRNEYRIRHRDGSYRWIASQGALERDARGTPTALHGVHLDVTELRILSSRVDTLTYTDPLTGLPNRNGITQQLGTVLAGSARRGTRTAVVCAGLDRFRGVNDSLGHDVGDEILQRAARAFAARMRTGDVLGRFGGDAFVLVAGDLAEPQDADTLAHQLRDALEDPIEAAGHPVALSCSVGVAVSPGDGRDAVTLLGRAEAAMNGAKTRGPGSVRFYAPDLNAEALTRLHLRTDLAAALRNGDLEAAFQPQVSLRDGSLVAVEALARWTHAEHGRISPEHFVAEAERSGQVMALGRTMRDLALANLTSWDVAGVGCARVAVNVSARELATGDLDRAIAADLERHGVAPARLEIEVTESAVMRAEDDALVTLARLRELGVRIAIDDFGTGYASLSYLRRLPADALKIDRGFVRGLGSSASRPDEALVRGVIDLAAAFGLDVVAEGVETEEERAFLIDVGCAVGQGYLFAKPMPGDDLTQWAPGRAPT
ncbi:MAG: EAL domain-containing protein [Trueperaceae bacterium]|nr:EAL domain-containing protein [Trueperaceae bacterium]